MRDVLITYLTYFDSDGFCLFERVGSFLAKDCSQITSWVASNSVSAVCVATQGVLM